MASKYDKVISKVFFDNHKDNGNVVPFAREELAEACKYHGIDRIKNLGDIPYSYRFRKALPQEINDTATTGCEWVILGTGRGNYEFRLCKISKIEPNGGRIKIKIPDATPEIVKQYAPANDEQALLAKVRYNRAVDLFLGLTCYSVQNHLRTTVAGVGQIEVDEIYIGINARGEHFVMPCQAKSPGDKFGIAQVLQDVLLCREKYPQCQCRPVAMQFLDANSFAMLELAIQETDGLLELVIVNETHYQLVGKDEISTQDLALYMKSKSDQ